MLSIYRGLTIEFSADQLIFAGNKAINENKFDNCKGKRHLNKSASRTLLIQFVIGDIAFSRTAINADVSTFQNFGRVITQ